MDPRGRTALVTGGAHRVGGAIAEALAEAGANIVINYRSSAQEAEQMVSKLRSLGVKALALQADIAYPDQVEAMVAKALEHFGAIDILVNSASLFKETPIPTRDISDWLYVTNVLINGAFFCANAVAPGMLAKGEGVIINIVDLSAWEPWPNFAAHSVGKAALWALTRQLALEFAPAVRANAVCPGPVLPPPNYTPERIARTAKKTLLNRWGSPKDITDAVLFLVRSDYITGEVIVVDGGERWGHRKQEPG